MSRTNWHLWCMFSMFFRVSDLIHHLKINAQSGGGAETAHFPLACATDAHLLYKTGIIL